MKRLLIAAPLVLLAACAKEDNEPGPGGVTVGEARALDEAAEMVEANQLPDDLAQTPAQAASKAPAAPAQTQAKKP